MHVYLLISTIIGGLIGWGTNVLAVKLIFRPYKPYRLLGLFSIQGLIPKRKGELAQAIGQTVAEELLTSDDIFQHLQSQDIQAKLSQEIIINIQMRIRNKIPAFIPTSIRDALFATLNGIVKGEVERFFKVNFPQITEELKDRIPISKIIEEKINQLDIRDLEKLIMAIAKKELKHIEYLGGLLGIIIGIIQGLIFTLLTSY